MALQKRPVALELRLKAEEEARKEAQKRFQYLRIRFCTGLLAVVTFIIVAAVGILAKEEFIDEVHSNRLEKLINEKDFVAVYWYSRKCKRCDEILEILETIDAEQHGVEFVKINDKRYARNLGINRFPTLTFFKDGEMTIFSGNLENKMEVSEFLTDSDALTLIDKIEEVSDESLFRIIREESFVAAFFYDQSKKSGEILAELEKIDDEADVFNIRIVRIQSQNLIEEYSLSSLPALVYYRSTIPLVYSGNLHEETDVLEWLIQHQSSINEDDRVESVKSFKELDIMIKNMDHLLVLFHDNKRKSQKALSALETIDGLTDDMGISFVEVDDQGLSKERGVRVFPSLVFYKNEIPAIYDGDLTDTEDVVEWIEDILEGSDIEEVTDEMLVKLIGTESKLAVYFYDQNDRLRDDEILNKLQGIADELEDRGISFVKIGGHQTAIDYGVEPRRPTLVLFEKGIPNLYEGNIADESAVMEWIITETSGDDTVEIVTKVMLDKMIKDYERVAVVLYDSESSRALEALETIDHLVSNVGFKLVKLDGDVRSLFGVNNLPTLIAFEDGIPNLFSGNLEDALMVKKWLEDIVKGDHIEDITPEMLDSLLETYRGKRTIIAVALYDPSNEYDMKIMEDLESIDDDLDDRDIVLVKVSDPEGVVAEKYRVNVVPGIVVFRKGKPKVFPGQINEEQRVIKWIIGNDK